jgi:transcription elongation factor Spt5
MVHILLRRPSLALGTCAVRIPGLVGFSEIERYIVRKPVIEDLYEDDVVEITGGPFKGMRAKITRIDKPKGEVTLGAARSHVYFADHGSLGLCETGGEV